MKATKTSRRSTSVESLSPTQKRPENRQFLGKNPRANVLVHEPMPLDEALSVPKDEILTRSEKK